VRQQNKKTARHKDNNRSDVKQMVREGVEGRPVERPGTSAANEEFTGTVNRRDALRREAGWDPFEVWQTRVKDRRRKPRERGKTRDSRR
jgi:hypothetical protein